MAPVFACSLCADLKSGPDEFLIWLDQVNPIFLRIDWVIDCFLFYSIFNGMFYGNHSKLEKDTKY